MVLPKATWKDFVQAANQLPKDIYGKEVYNHVYRF